MENLYLDISDYLPDEEVEATNKAIKTLSGEDEQYYYIESKMNKNRRKGAMIK